MWADLAATCNLDVYFCDPHAPWQRGLNEHTNRLLRWWLPKGADLSVQSPTDLAAILNVLNHQPRVDVLRTVPTASGFMTEHVESRDVGGEVLSARRLWLCEVRDGQIAEVIGYCSGEWDEQLRARHAVEAPMIRR